MCLELELSELTRYMGGIQVSPFGLSPLGFSFPSNLDHEIRDRFRSLAGMIELRILV